MSIEQKIAEMLNEYKPMGTEGGSNSAKGSAQSGDQTPIRTATNVIPASNPAQNADNERNDYDNEDEAANATSQKPNRATASAVTGDAKPFAAGPTGAKPNMKEDIDALMNGEELSEEFRQKAETIFEAAVVTRVNEEIARIEESYEVKLQEATEQIKEGMVEQVDGYLDYIVEQWIAQNEIALERGMKSEILEGFVAGLKDLFEEHYVDIPEEKFDVLASMEDKVGELEAKLNEQVAANVEMNKTLGTIKRQQIVQEASAGLTDTEVEKFNSLAEELSYEDADTFKTKVQTIRENYFTNKTITEIQSVVTDTPVEVLTEEKAIDPNVKRYMAVLNNIK
jgi:hypothetical protein